VQKLRRTKNASNVTNVAKNVNYALALYFYSNALRAPHVPTDVKGLRALYRGVTLDAGQLRSLLQSKIASDDGYMAFTRKQDFAVKMMQSVHRRSPERVPVLFRLRLSDVPASTPWIWFTHPSNGATRDPRWNTSLYRDQHEVLLPPGKLVVKAVSDGNSGGYVVDVKYVPGKSPIMRYRSGRLPGK
jgi:hypothetical protein